jgi:hypothetical protein
MIVADDHAAVERALDADGWVEVRSPVLGRTLLIVRSGLPPPEARIGKEPWDWWRESEWALVRYLPPDELQAIALVREVFTDQRKVGKVLPGWVVPPSDLLTSEELRDDLRLLRAARVRQHRDALHW